jgi:hypothetical protein
MRLVSKILAVFVLLLISTAASAQTVRPKKQTRTTFGPNVQAYLDYLKSELTVTDVPESQSEISPEYVRHNFNRVSALRQFAIKLAGETEIDFVPEMEAVAQNEFHLLFSQDAPTPAELKAGEVYASYRYLGSVRNRETFYIFSRLDPFEEEAQNPKSQKLQNTAIEPKLEQSSPVRTETKSAVVEPKPETPGLTRERILYGADDKPKSARKEPNR